MKLIVLDRDGVINQDSVEYIKSPTEWISIHGSLQAIADLNQSGYRVVVATNQSGLARGLFNIETLNAIHHKMQNELEKIGGHIDGIFFCPHGPDDRCECRKPKPGLLAQVSQRFFTDTSSILSIGDSMRDLRAAESYGVKHIHVLTGAGEQFRKEIARHKDVPIFDDLASAVQNLLST